ncbi:MAG: ADP-ribosylglycohydrolase family protein, partial [Verrucomicrobiales bacterium]
FFGDALALGPHWIYDAEEIARLYPQGVTTYDAPRSAYHSGKLAGDFTHYGDQTLVLLESVSKRGKFDRGGWKEDWLAFWNGSPNSYRDGATRRTLENCAAGLEAPSDSHDLGGASRIAALFALDFEDDEAALVAAADQTQLTHDDPLVTGAAEFFMIATRRVQEGLYFPEAFQEAAELSSAAPDLAIGFEASDWETDRIAELGLGCAVGGAALITIALALKFEGSPTEALMENARLAGDSAARGILLGLLLGARHGASVFPADWVSGLRAGSRIEALLAHQA